MVIRWRTTEPVETRLEYRTSPEAVAKVSHSSALTTEHEVKLTGLTCQTRYFYKIIANSKVLAGDDSDHYFVTFPRDTHEPTRVWVLGDAGTSGWLKEGEDPNQGAVRDAFLKRHTLADVSFVMLLGDNAYNVGSDEQYQRGFFDPYRSVLRSKVVWPTQGNHDHATKAYYSVFTLPTNGESGGVPSGTEHYYSFDHGNAHFISLNSENRDPSFRASMIGWLRKDLAGNSKSWTIVFWHHPPYSKGNHDSDDLKDSGGRMAWMRENIVPLLDEAGVDLVFTGHSHSYERSKFITRYYGLATEFSEKNIVHKGRNDGANRTTYAKNSLVKHPYSGTVYVCAGNAGNVEPGALNHPVMAVSREKLGSVFLTINGDDVQATMIGADGEVEDSFTIRKGGG
jgi:predicted phosphodiesterase